MPTPTIVVFDLGKVLVDFDYTIAARKLAEHCGQPPEEVKKHLDYSPVLLRYESGLMTREEFFGVVRELTGFRGPIDMFASFFADIFWEIPRMIAIQAALRRNRIPTYIFSNTNDLAIEHIRRNFPFFANFDGYILSYEVRAMKPDAKIYEELEHLAGKQGAEILYLDDRQENVDAGAVRGWQVILQTDPEKSVAAMKQLGLPVH